METLILYRGDAIEIEEFRFHKTHSYCLLGRGIYLTDRIAVAETYRSKGASQLHKNFNPDHYQDNFLLEQKLCKNKLEALEKASKVYSVRLYEKRYNKRHHVPTVDKKTKKVEFVASKEFLDFQRKIGNPEFQRLLELGQVVVEAQNKLEGRVFTVKIINRNKKELGKVTEFRFPKDFFERNIVKTHEMSLDECHLLWEHDLHKKASQYTSVSEFIEKEFKRNSWYSKKNFFNINDNYLLVNWNKFRNVLLPFGVIGYEYPGGMAIGGSGYHRAFSVWDEDFVNKHRVG